MLSGFPSSAKYIKEMHIIGDLNEKEATKLLTFTHFSNPLFILTTVAIFFFNNKGIGIILLISHYLSNFILGILFRKYFNHDDKDTINKHNYNIDFGTVLIGAIRKSIDTILLICGIVTIFLLLSSIISDIFNFNIYSSMLVKGILEITIGIEALSKIPLSLTYKTVITSCFLAFGGFSVHMQVMSQIVDTDINYKYFFIGRLFQTVISGFITCVICLFSF